MSMTDPIADLLTRIRNAQTAKHRELALPASRVKADIVKILMDSGYIESFKVEKNPPQGTIHIELKYDPAGQGVIRGLERVSRPGRRVYCGKDSIPRVLDGLGVTILSTPRGIMADAACRKAGVGGEVLCSIW